jgi:MFS family permease
MGLPATFAVVAEGLGQGRRAIGFGVQSILKRIPIIVAPAVGGALMARLGIVPGFRAALVLTIALALLTFLVQQRLYPRRETANEAPPARPKGALSAVGPALRRLLVPDILARTAEGIPAALFVIYATTNLGASLALYGALRGLQMLTSIVCYLPAAKLADRWSPRPLIALTFGFFGLYPLAFALHPMFPAMPVAAFLAGAAVVAGLREIGEPARKALIVDLAEPERRGEAVGAYYLARGLLVAPAPILGGALWGVSPQLAFGAAAVAGTASVALFLWRGPRPPEEEGF